MHPDTAAPESIQHELLACVRDLPPEKQIEVRDFAAFLKMKENQKEPRTTLEGTWSHLPEISDRDIEELRAEMWGSIEKKWDRTERKSSKKEKA